MTTLRTLVLNIGYEPVRVVRWSKAMTKVFKGKAIVLETYDAKIKTSHKYYDVPAVIWLTSRDRYMPKVRLSRYNVFARDLWTCQFCGEQFPSKDLTFDHVVPRAQGGKTAWNNIVTCCRSCNQEKRDRTPKQAGMQLLSKPKRPRWMPKLLVESFRNNTIPSEWEEYVSWVLEK